MHRSYYLNYSLLVLFMMTSICGHSQDPVLKQFWRWNDTKTKWPTTLSKWNASNLSLDEIQVYLQSYFENKYALNYEEFHSNEFLNYNLKNRDLYKSKDQLYEKSDHYQIITRTIAFDHVYIDDDKSVIKKNLEERADFYTKIMVGGYGGPIIVNMKNCKYRNTTLPKEDYNAGLLTRTKIKYVYHNYDCDCQDEKVKFIAEQINKYAKRNVVRRGEAGCTATIRENLDAKVEPSFLTELLFSSDTNDDQGIEYQMGEWFTPSAFRSSSVPAGSEKAIKIEFQCPTGSSWSGSSVSEYIGINSEGKYLTGTNVCGFLTIEKVNSIDEAKNRTMECSCFERN